MPTPAGSGVEDHQDGPREYDIAELQHILIGLGWRGNLTTSGPLSPALQDGLYGPITRADWEQSAKKRNLDPTFERVTGQTAHVDPDTYDALKALARSKGGVVGARRKMYIP